MKPLITIAFYILCLLGCRHKEPKTYLVSLEDSDLNKYGGADIRAGIIYMKYDTIRIHDTVPYISTVGLLLNIDTVEHLRKSKNPFQRNKWKPLPLGNFDYVEEVGIFKNKFYYRGKIIKHQTSVATLSGAITGSGYTYQTITGKIIKIVPETEHSIPGKVSIKEWRHIDSIMHNLIKDTLFYSGKPTILDGSTDTIRFKKFKKQQ